VAYLDFGRAVRGVDSILRHHYRVKEFTDDEECIFRIAVVPSQCAVRLSDGTGIKEGDPVLHLHFWNEHLPQMGTDGPSTGWANLMKRRVQRSLATVSRHLDRERQFDAVQALHGSPPFASRLGAAQMVRTAHRFGFDVIEPDAPAELHKRIHEMLDSMVLWSMAYTFNPAALRSKGLPLRRHQLWISRSRLQRYYGGAATEAASAHPH
jgi:hypothetical protein